jgi:bacterial/archaeal transporter family protein
MSWIFYALLAPAISAIVIFIDKYLIESKVNNYFAMPIYAGIVAMVAGSIFWVVTGFPILEPQSALIVMTTGALSAFAMVFYFKGLSFDGASTVNFLIQTFPIITLVLSYLFLNEVLTSRQLIGFFLVLASAIGVSIDTKAMKGKFHVTKAFFYIIAVAFLWAVAGVLIKFAININSFAEILSYESFGIGLGALIVYFVYKPTRIAFHEENKKLKRVTILTIFFNEGLFVISRALTFFAFSLGPIALVSALAGSQAFFAVLYGLVLGTIAPKIFKEDLRQKTLYIKFILASVLLLGIFFISS